MNVTLAQAKNKLLINLARIGAEHEAKQIIYAATGIEPANQPLSRTYELTQSQAIVLQDLMNRRVCGEPLQYILGEWDFYGLNFELGTGVLIPRNDTEILVEQALYHLNKTDAVSVLDLCSGTGCIAIALAVNCDVQVTAVDISPVAIEYMTRNAKRHEVDLCIIKSDMFANIPGKFDLIVSNPPYIPSAQIKTLDATVKDYEPVLALDGGEDGLEYYREIAKHASRFLNPKGALMLEIGIGQSLNVARLLAKAGYTRIEYFDDYNGICRVISCRAPN